MEAQQEKLIDLLQDSLWALEMGDFEWRVAPDALVELKQRLRSAIAELKRSSVSASQPASVPEPAQAQ